MIENHILNNVIGWRPDDYDGFNDYYVNNHKNKKNEVDK